MIFDESALKIVYENLTSGCVDDFPITMMMIFGTHLKSVGRLLLLVYCFPLSLVGDTLLTFADTEWVISVEFVRENAYYR